MADTNDTRGAEILQLALQLMRTNEVVGWSKALAAASEQIRQAEDTPDESE